MNACELGECIGEHLGMGQRRSVHGSVDLLTAPSAGKGVQRGFRRGSGWGDLGAVRDDRNEEIVADYHRFVIPPDAHWSELRRQSENVGVKLHKSIGDP